MNKKQFSSIILALMILGTRVGFALNVHYCGSQIAAISLASHPSNCGMEMEENEKLPETTSFTKTSCCKDDTLLFQNHEPQKFESDSRVISLSVNAIVPSESFELLKVLISNQGVLLKWVPPPPRKNKIYLLNHSFVVYG